MLGNDNEISDNGRCQTKTLPTEKNAAIPTQQLDTTIMGSTNRHESNNGASHQQTRN
jgi:hypothetical protein